MQDPASWSPSYRSSQLYAQVRFEYLAFYKHTLLNHLLDGARRVDLHSKEIVKTVDFGGIL